MSLRSIFLFAAAEVARPDTGPASFAIDLARRHGARLTAFVTALDVTTPGRDSDAGAVAAALTEAARQAGVDCETVTQHSHAVTVHEAVCQHARLHDLVVTGTDDGSLLSERNIAENLLFESGRPVVLVPAGHAAAASGSAVAVAWDSTAAAARALGDAVSLLEIENVDFVTVSGEKDLPEDLTEALLVSTSARRGLRAAHRTVELGSRSIAAALQQEAQAGGTALLVMGAFGHSNLRRYVLGSATSDLLAGLAMPVLLSR